jgi:hypothetical protein
VSLVTTTYTTLPKIEGRKISTPSHSGLRKRRTCGPAGYAGKGQAEKDKDWKKQGKKLFYKEYEDLSEADNLERGSPASFDWLMKELATISGYLAFGRYKDMYTKFLPSTPFCH